MELPNYPWSRLYIYIYIIDLKITWVLTTFSRPTPPLKASQIRWFRRSAGSHSPVHSVHSRPSEFQNPLVLSMADIPRRVMHEVKQENVDVASASPGHPNELSRSSFSDTNSASATGPKTEGALTAKKELDGSGMASSVGVQGPFSLGEPQVVQPPTAVVPQPLSTGDRSSADQACKLFWKAGDYEGASGCNSDSFSGSTNFLFLVMVMLLFLVEETKEMF